MATYTVPETMRSLCTRKFGPPSKWEIAELPTPKITRDDEVLIRVHAAAINPTDIGGAAGRYWPAFSVPWVFLSLVLSVGVASRVWEGG
jgi:NADPH:quinone reductase-like Zn-dependent oxidoreductase